MRDLHLAVGVLVHRERIDDAHRVALLQALELGDDLAVELGVAEAEHDELNGTDRHGCSFSLLELATPMLARLQGADITRCG